MTKEYIQKGVTIIVDKPPVWNSVVNTFNVLPKNTIFAYGDVIYNPDDIDIQDYLLEHEKVHFKQQGNTKNGAALWWGKFLRDSDFRVDQEVEAYAHQYNQMCKATKDRNQPVKILFHLATTLSGPLYNYSIDTGDAMKRIKERAKTKII